MEVDSLFTLPFAKYNINNKISYVSDNKGQFGFWAKPGDLVSFSYVGFKTLYLPIVDSLNQNNIVMGVFLSRDTIQLSEVVIIPQLGNPEAMAKNMPLLSRPEDVVAQRNVDMSVYQAKTQPEAEWDAEMNQKNFIQARSNDVAYRTQVQSGQMVGVGNVSIEQAATESRIRKIKAPQLSYISQQEWESLISTYQERQRKKFSFDD